MTNIPAVIFKTRTRNDNIAGENPFEWRDVSSASIFSKRKIVLFALPGAFTPTCSSTHLPGYEAAYANFLAAGVDDLYCLSVNDAFSMFQWANQLGIKNVKMLPDGNADFTRQMGMLVKKENLGFGARSWRYSMLVDDGKIVKMFAEANKMDNAPNDPFECSDAPTMLGFLKDN
ncbi:MAG: peroxiredoxin [Pseudomonadales bacterium]|nr:peroxiredoxin [Pseudomonadales bacterium]